MTVTRGFARTTARAWPWIAASVAVAASFAACGMDVSLGGTSDGGTPDATTGLEGVVGLCEPCTSSANCPALAACATVSENHTFCVTRCPHGTECDTGSVCQAVSTVPSEPVRACTPKLGACQPPKSPTNDGAPLDHCGSLDAPSVRAACSSCDKADRDCQKNGCYGGWWCNALTKRCQRPPASCP